MEPKRLLYPSLDSAFGAPRNRVNESLPFAFSIDLSASSTWSSDKLHGILRSTCWAVSKVAGSMIAANAFGTTIHSVSALVFATPIEPGCGSKNHFDPLARQALSSPGR